MAVVFTVHEDTLDLTEWFIRCVDSTIRDEYRLPYHDNQEARDLVRGKLKEHNSVCEICSLTEQGAELEVASNIDYIEDIDVNDATFKTLCEVLALSINPYNKEYGWAESNDLQGRILMAFAFIEPKGKQFSSTMSNIDIIEHLKRLYALSDEAKNLRREISWFEYPED